MSYKVEQKKSSEWEETINTFLNRWNLDLIKKMDLNNYIEFINDVEYGTAKYLGSMRGANAFKFGIFKMKYKKSYHRTTYMSDDNYAWCSKFGKNSDEAFKNVRNLVIKVIDSSKKNNISEINSIDLWKLYKWKIAFIYNNNKSILPIYSDRPLNFLKDKFRLIAKDKSEIYNELLSLNNGDFY